MFSKSMVKYVDLNDQRCHYLSKTECAEVILTRLHSSRMLTARALTVSPSMLCTGGWGAWSWRVPGLGGAWSGTGIPACNEADPPVNRMTDRCKNITLPQTSFAGGNK